ncbi:MAG: 2-oxo acid dehydrogenase subunit E2 [Eubacterium ramulus]
MNIQLSVDHRLIDGLLASRFVEYMKELLENPLKTLTVGGRHGRSNHYAKTRFQYG